MSIPRIYISSGYISKDDKQIVLPQEISRRILKVLRLKKNDTLVLFDGVGNEYQVIVTEIIKGKDAKVEIIKKEHTAEENGLIIALLQGLPKGEKMDFIVQKTTELGVKKIIPVISERSIPKLTEPKISKKVDRWYKIAISAAEQCGAARLPSISEPKIFLEAIKEVENYELKLLFYEKERKNTFKAILSEHPMVKKIAVFIGPEGGFSEQEVSDANKLGFIPVSLGKQILRTETAPITILSILRYVYDDLQ